MTCNYLFHDLDKIFGNADVIGILNRIESQKQVGKKYSDDDYSKYGLSDDEIDFIESHVKAMA